MIPLYRIKPTNQTMTKTRTTKKIAKSVKKVGIARIKKNLTYKRIKLYEECKILKHFLDVN